MEINAKDLAVMLLNNTVARDDCPQEIQGRIYAALALLDPQPEDGELFYDAITLAYEDEGKSIEELENILHALEEELGGDLYDEL